jgi:hypothetical protein
MLVHGDSGGTAKEEPARFIRGATGGLVQHARTLHKTAENETGWISLGEVLNTNSTDMQRKIHNLQHGFIVDTCGKLSCSCNHCKQKRGKA